MSLHYLLDGYNIIKQSALLGAKPLDAGRRALVQLINIHRPQGSTRNKVTIVFDGQPGIISSPNPSSVEIIFSVNGTADDKIRQLVEEAANPRVMVVVTNDREIIYAVRRLGVRVMSVEDFMVRLGGPGETNFSLQKKERSVGKHIAYTTEHKITKELEAIWIKKKSHGNS